jgi:hypothetical protein
MSDVQRYRFQPVEIFIWVLASTPILVQFWVVTEFRTDLVILDEFRHILPRVQHLLEGKFSFLNDLWRSQNVHKPVVPLAFIFLNAYFTGWNIVYEQLGGLMGYVLLFVVLVRHQMRISRAAGIKPVNWTIPATAFLLFSLTSWKVFYMGYASLQHGWAIFGSIAGLIVLARPGFKWKDFALSILLGLVGTLSFSTALLFWPAAFFILLWKLVEGRFKNVALWIAVPLWLVITKVVVVLYKTHMSDPVNAMSFLKHFGRNVEFTLVFAGAPIANTEVGTAVYTAIGGVVALCLLAYGLIAHRKVELHSLVPYFAMALFTLGAGFLTSTGRIQYGSESSLGRDWKIFATPMWISIVVLLNLFVHAEPVSRFARIAKSRLGVARPRLALVLSIVSSIALVVCAGSFVRSNYKEIDDFKVRHRKMSRAEKVLNLEILALEKEVAAIAENPRGRRRSAQADALSVAQRVPFKKVIAVHPKVPERKFRRNLAFLEKNRLANFNR